MADVYEKNLTDAESVGSGDKVRMVMSDNSSQKADFSVVAKAMVESYDGSSLAGANQSVKEAVDGLKTSVESWESANRTQIYGAVWDRTTNKLTRTNAAAGITTDTTNFGHFGSINSNYNNPFDSIYPWSELQVVNVDLTMWLTGEHTLKECITAVYGDPDFTWIGSATRFVGRYRPEFWYRSVEDESGKVTYQISQCERAGWLKAEEAIDGIGFAIDAGTNGSSQAIVTAGAGIPLTNVACSTIHARAKNNGCTLRDIYDLSAVNMLYLVEYADMNSQAALGDGCSSQYRENSADVINSVSTTSTTTVIEVLNTASGFTDCLKVGAQIDIGASAGATTYRAILKSFEQNSGGTGYKLTLDGQLSSVTTGMIISFHGFAACEWPYLGTSIGNASGYLGVSGKANAYYRGATFHANRYEYILGIYRKSGNNHIYLCPRTLKADDYDGLNTSVHVDTGKALPTLESGAWLTIGSNAQRIPDAPGYLLTGTSSGSSSSPVGDQQYVPSASTGDTVLFFGGFSGLGWSCGCFCGSWGPTAGSSYWYCAGRPVLK